MSGRTILYAVLLTMAGFYFAPRISTFFQLDGDRCDEYYEVYSEGEYSVEYGERMHAVLEGCF